MPSQKAAISAGATGAAVVVAAAAAVYWARPNVIWPEAVPAGVTERAHEASAPAAPAVLTERAPAPAQTAPSPPAAAPLVASAAVKPAFDVVTVDPAGEAVVAGRAAPNTKVELKDAGKTVAEATTDAQGDFVMTPPPLPPGEHSLSLATRAGPTETTSNAIAVSVPQPAPKAPVAAAPSAPPASAASPPAANASAPPSGPVRVAIQSVEASAGGRLVAKGAAEPNTTVRLYLGGAFVGDAKTLADGRWSLTIRHGMTPGAYAVRADEINPGDASVVARAEAPFNFPESPTAPPSAPASAPTVASADASLPASTSPSSPADVVVDSVQTTHVVRGNTLWGLSQTYYGDGSRYQIIFAANANQIRDPHWIYPGQMFVVPKAQPKP